MRYLALIFITLFIGCSVSKSNLEKKDLKVNIDSNVVKVVKDSISTGSKDSTKSIVIDNSITEILETKVDSLNKTTTITKTTKKNSIVTSTTSEVEDFFSEVKVEKKDSTNSLNITDKGKIKSSIERSSYGIYGIGFVLLILVILIIKYYKKFISLLL